MTTTTATKTAGPTCPDWCEDRANGHAADAEHGRQHGEWSHRATMLDSDGMNVGLAWMQCRPNPVAGDDYGVFVEVSQDDCLTPEQAQRLAAAILTAARTIEGGVR